MTRREHMLVGFALGVITMQLGAFFTQGPVEPMATHQARAEIPAAPAATLQCMEDDQ